jgi:undecaprenyl-diphosphatase
MVNALVNADVALLRWVLATFRTPWLDPWMAALGPATLYGLPFVLLGALVVAQRRDGWSVMALWRIVLAVWLASLAVSYVFKPALGRERPFVADSTITVVGTPARGASMPSGHAATAAAGALALGLLWPAGRVLAWALAALILFSRVYLGQHYPSDVLVGALVGWACAYFATAATHWRPRDLEALK